MGCNVLTKISTNSYTVLTLKNFLEKIPLETFFERSDKTMGILEKKSVFEKINADWLSELQSSFKKYNKTIHSSIKVSPNQASVNFLRKKYLTFWETKGVKTNLIFNQDS